MGQNEDTQPLVRRADFCRAEETRRRRVAHVPKLSQHGFKAKGDMTVDVFEEDPLGGAFSNNPGDVGPEVAWIGGTAALSSCAERLAGISGEDGVEGTPEAPCVEAAQVVPDWGGAKIPGALGCNEDRPRPIFPFDKGTGVIPGLGEHEAQIKATAACTEG